MSDPGIAYMGSEQADVRVSRTPNPLAADWALRIRPAAPRYASDGPEPWRSRPIRIEKLAPRLGGGSFRRKPRPRPSFLFELFEHLRDRSVTAAFNGLVLASRLLGAGPDRSGLGRRPSMVVGRLSKLGAQGRPVAVALAGLEGRRVAPSGQQRLGRRLLGGLCCSGRRSSPSRRPQSSLRPITSSIRPPIIPSSSSPSTQTFDIGAVLPCRTWTFSDGSWSG